VEQQSHTLSLHEGNDKDDIAPWLKWTRWPQLFEGKNLRVVSSFDVFAELTEVDLLDMSLGSGITTVE